MTPTKFVLAVANQYQTGFLDEGSFVDVKERWRVIFLLISTDNPMKHEREFLADKYIRVFKAAN